MSSKIFFADFRWSRTIFCAEKNVVFRIFMKFDFDPFFGNLRFLTFLKNKLCVTLFNESSTCCGWIHFKAKNISNFITFTTKGVISYFLNVGKTFLIFSAIEKSVFWHFW